MRALHAERPEMNPEAQFETFLDVVGPAHAPATRVAQ
jgi:hypothetical protein